jgi:chorismate mutase/GNAT superfamily N-acetyltransferase
MQSERPRPEEVEVRRGTTAEASEVARIHLAARRASPMPPPVHTDDEVTAWMRGRAEQDEIWVAEAAGDLLGYARMSGPWLDDLYVDPPHMRQGIGGMLLDTVKALHPEGFGLWVFEANQPARAFYAQHGLLELERTDGSGNEERTPDIRMVWGGDDPVRFLRSLIDGVDDELGALLERRAALTRVVQRVKAVQGRPPRDKAREREIADRLGRRAPSLPLPGLIRIVEAIVGASVESGVETRVETRVETSPPTDHGADSRAVGGSAGSPPGDHLE